MASNYALKTAIYCVKYYFSEPRRHQINYVDKEAQN